MKSGFVAVAGRPNVGKSTLVNALCGGKVAIVSDKPQTTRRRILGIANGDDYQLVLVDLPGFQRPRDALTERMQRTVDHSFDDVDAVLLVLDARERIGAGDRFIAGRVFALGVPVVIALNKVDRLKPGHIASRWRRRAPRRLPRAASGQREDGRRHRRAARRARRAAARGPALLPARSSAPTCRSRRRSPSSSARRRSRSPATRCRTRSRSRSTRSRRPSAPTIFVETESQKQIVVGKGGSIVKEIGTRARPEIERCSGTQIFLDLQVKVRPHWRRDEAMLERLGI